MEYSGVELPGTRSTSLGAFMLFINFFLRYQRYFGHAHHAANEMPLS
jgi:hypothetical protein